jgi:hypothetical protein
VLPYSQLAEHGEVERVPLGAAGEGEGGDVRVERVADGLGHGLYSSGAA